MITAFVFTKALNAWTCTHPRSRAKILINKCNKGFLFAIPLQEGYVNLVSATKVALVDISPITIVWLRFAMGVVILEIAVAWRRQFALPNKNEWGYFALLGFLGITFHQWLQSNGLITSEASTTAWIVATTPFFMALLGWLFTSILFIPSEGLAEIPHLTTNGWIGVLFLGIFCSGLAYIAWYDALQVLSAAQTGVFLYIEPFVAVIVAAVVLAEPITWPSLLGGVEILFGVWLVNRDERERN